MVAGEIRLWKGIRLGRGPSLPGCVFEQQGKEAAKPVLSVGSGLGEDPDDPNSEASSTGLLRLSCLPLLFISLYLVGPVAGRT